MQTDRAGALGGKTARPPVLPEAKAGLTVQSRTRQLRDITWDEARSDTAGA